MLRAHTGLFEKEAKSESSESDENEVGEGTPKVKQNESLYQKISA